MVGATRYVRPVIVEDADSSPFHLVGVHEAELYRRPQRRAPETIHPGVNDVRCAANQQEGGDFGVALVSDRRQVDVSCFSLVEGGADAEQDDGRGIGIIRRHVSLHVRQRVLHPAGVRPCACQVVQLLLQSRSFVLNGEVLSGAT